VLGWFKGKKGDKRDAPKTKEATPRAQNKPKPRSSSSDDFASLLSKDGFRLELAEEALAAREQYAERISKLSDLVYSHSREHADELPAFPSIATRIMQLVQEREAETSDLEEIIQNDGAIVARVMKYANSSMYSRGVEIDVLRSAIVRIGRDELAMIAVAAAVRANLLQQYTRRFNAIWSQLWQHSMTTAVGARWLSGRKDKERGNRAFLSGLMHDIGKVAALNSIATLVKQNEIDEDIPDIILNLVLENTHVLLGVRMLTNWELPKYVINTVERHADRDIGGQGSKNELVHMVRCVDGLDEARREMIWQTSVRAQVETSAAALSIGSNAHREILNHLEMFGQQCAEY